MKTTKLTSGKVYRHPSLRHGDGWRYSVAVNRTHLLADAEGNTRFFRSSTDARNAWLKLDPTQREEPTKGHSRRLPAVTDHPFQQEQDERAKTAMSFIYANC